MRLSFISIILASLVALSACSRAERTTSANPATANTLATAAERQSPGKEATMTTTDAHLTWSLARSGQSLRVTYRIENRGKQRLYVCDGLIVSLKPATFTRSPNVAVQVLDATSAQIRVGQPSGDVPMAVAPPSLYVPVEPGSVFEGERDVPLPLSHWDAMGRRVEWSKTLKTATFVIEYFLGEPPSWSELTGQGGRPLKVAIGFTPRSLMGPALTLP